MTAARSPRPAAATHDYHLVLRIGRGNQLSFEMLEAWGRLRGALGPALAGELEVESRPPYAMWRFTSTRAVEEVAAAVGQALGDDVAWAVSGGERLEYAGWQRREFEALLRSWQVVVGQPALQPHAEVR